MSLVTIEQIIPTYLREFLQEDTKCIIVHKKVKVPSKYSSDGDSEISFDATEGDLDLTGNPLQVDLNNSVMIIQNGMPQIQSHWTIAESQHYPLELGEARNFLNLNFNMERSPHPKFCITNGKDGENTVIIGNHNSEKYFKTYLVRHLGLYAENSTRLSLDNLRKIHEKHVRFEADSICYKFKKIYNIHGHNIYEIPNSENSSYNGCIVLETCWNTEEKEPGEAQIKILLKVISGHKQSSIHFLFEQLKTLHNLMRIKANQYDRSTIISIDSLTISELTNRIQSLCLNNTKMKKNRAPNVLDLSDLREETILDKLWHLLVRCRSLEDLKNSLCVFFTIVKREHFDESDNVLQCIAEECLKIPDYTSKMTFLDCLNLLLYIGFEKLKRDYFTLTYFYHPIRQARLLQKWSEFKSLDCQKSRGTKINDVDNNKKFTFLKNLHRVSELLTFSKRDVKNCSELSNENFDIICSNIFEKYHPDKLDNECEIAVELLEISCQLDSKNESLYKNKTSVTSIFEYLSRVQQSDIKTVFHVSRNPIFPKCMFEDYENITKITDVSNGDMRDDLLYVSMLIELKRLF